MPAPDTDARRRRLLLGLAALPLGCATGPAATGDEVAREVADGVFLLPGVRGEIGPDTRGRIGNAGFIVGPGGVIAIDSGTSHRHGLARLAAIRRVTAQPLRALVLTQARQEFLFGATAFQAAGVPVVMHRDAMRLMTGRCEGCLKTLHQLLGAGEMADTRVPQIERVVTDAEVDAGTALPDIGRPVRLLAPPPGRLAASPGHLAVLDTRTGTLFAGALLDAGTIPDVQDADLAGWHAALAELRALPLRQAIPGHGPAAPATTLIDRVERYLTQLAQRTAALLAAGVPLSEVADATELPDFAGDDHYDTTHRRNASIVFLRQERALMLGPTPH
ncbi:MBL fold metallo-hydrolase [uncultured Sphaerotilus sp.]|uniref:MBL fold metallo-hydrolase n=1 Tax=uncultured Sphaerotilus sp. TaxID=474984 RepID=UPI0030CA3AAE